MRDLKLELKKIQVYRGLINDEISFMEIRRKGKKRQKYLVKQILGEWQLFPPVQLSQFKPIVADSGKSTIVETLIGTGCLAKYTLINRTQFELGELQFLTHKSSSSRHFVLLSAGAGSAFHFVSDDLVVREHELYIY